MGVGVEVEVEGGVLEHLHFESTKIDTLHTTNSHKSQNPEITKMQ